MRSSASRGVSPLALALAFGRLSLTTFGGAQSAAIRREIVTSRGWLNEDEFLEFRGIAMITPGPNSPNLAILVGQHLAGTAGAIAAFAAATIPGAVLVLLFGAVFLNPHLAGLRAALRGCAAAAVGLTLANALETTIVRRFHRVQLAIVAASAAAVIVFGASLWLTLLIFLPISIGFAIVLERERPANLVDD